MMNLALVNSEQQKLNFGSKTSFSPMKRKSFSQGSKKNTNAKR